MSKNDLIAAAGGTAAASSEWDVRGHLAASLTCWHRLTSKEADELVAMFQGRSAPATQQAGALSDKQIKEHGDKASRMMARDMTRFDAACEVDKYLRDQGAPMYYRHRMSIVLFGNTEGTDAARAPDNAPQPSPWDPQHTTAHGRTVPPPPFPPAPPRSTPMEAADLKTAAKLEMADEYQRWIDHFHKGGDYDSFLRIELSAAKGGL